MHLFDRTMMAVAIGCLLAGGALADSKDPCHAGAKPELAPELRQHVRVALFGASGYTGGSYEGIKQILDLERRTNTVEQAIAVKRSGLPLAPRIEDFLLLCTPAFSNPSDSYRAALSEFIANNVAGRVVPGDSFQHALVLEARCTRVDHAMAVKRACLAVVRNTDEFDQVARPAFSNPSDSYRNELGDFIAASVGQACTPGSSLDALLRIEARAAKVEQAIAVKRAAMAIVGRVEEFEVISRPAFSNPSDSYKAEASSFIAANAGRAIRPDSDIGTILRIEARCTRVEDAMAVKRAGLAAVHSREDLMRLGRPAFSNPSDTYLRELGNFIAQHAGGVGGSHP